MRELKFEVEHETYCRICGTVNYEPDNATLSFRSGTILCDGCAEEIPEDKVVVSGLEEFCKAIGEPYPDDLYERSSLQVFFDEYKTTGYRTPKEYWDSCSELPSSGR